MRIPLSISTVGHAAIIGWGLVALPSVDAFESNAQPPLPIDIVTVAEFTKITAGTRDGDKELPPAPPEPVEKAKPVEQPKPEPKPLAEPAVAPAPIPEPSPEPAPTPLRTAALTPDEPLPEPEAKPEPEPTPTVVKDAPVPRVKPKVAAKPKPPAPKAEPKAEPKSFEPDKIAALLNKIPDSGGATPTTTGSPTPSLGAASGTESNLSMSEIDALRSQIARCWNPPVGVVDARDLLVRIGMELNPDGTLAGPPVLLNSSYDPIFTVAAEAAIRAVTRCQPYALPPEKYTAWQQINMTFDPRELLGG